MSNQKPILINDLLDKWFMQLKTDLLRLVNDFIRASGLVVVREDKPVDVNEMYARAKLHIIERLSLECVEWTRAKYGIVQPQLKYNGFHAVASPCHGCDDDCKECPHK